jgi:hypothetical protein
MTACQSADGEDDRIRPAAPFPKSAIAKAVSPYGVAGMRPAANILVNLAVLIFLAIGTIAFCLLLSLGDRVLH